MVWKSKAAGRTIEQADERILAAADLAGFSRADQAARSRELAGASDGRDHRDAIFADRGLFVVNAEGTTIPLGSSTWR